jgi:hypothetical protein
LDGWSALTQCRYLHIEQHKHSINTDIHVSSGVRTHDPSVRAGEDSSWLRPRGHCDRGQFSCPSEIIIYDHVCLSHWVVNNVCTT